MRAHAPGRRAPPPLAGPLGPGHRLREPRAPGNLGGQARGTERPGLKRGAGIRGSRNGRIPGAKAGACLDNTDSGPGFNCRVANFHAFLGTRGWMKEVAPATCRFPVKMAALPFPLGPFLRNPATCVGQESPHASVPRTHSVVIFTLPQKVTEMNEQVLKPQKTILFQLRH